MCIRDSTRKDKIKVKTIYNRSIHFDTWKKIEGIHYTDNLDELLNDKDIQVIGPKIFLCTPKNIGVTGSITLDDDTPTSTEE